jgi:DNA-binding transcriptional MerR regulator
MLSIGEFARRASVSVKTLRFYHKVGVFQPARVDSRSGYRYYEIDQLETLRELRLLRELGCGITELRSWVDVRGESADRRTAVLLQLRNRLQQQLISGRERLRFVDRWVQDINRTSDFLQRGTPAERTIPSIPALTIRDRVRAGDPTIYRMFEAAERAAARQQARMARQPFLLLHNGEYRSKNLDVEVCIPVHPRALCAVSGRVVEGARRAACLEFVGSYDQAPTAYKTILSWMQVTGARAVGPLRETYLRFGADQQGYRLPKRFVACSIGEYRTELQLPIVARRVG